MTGYSVPVSQATRRVLYGAKPKVLEHGPIRPPCRCRLSRLIQTAHHSLQLWRSSPVWSSNQPADLFRCWMIDNVNLPAADW